MTPEQHVILDVTFAVLGGLVGWLLCREQYRARAWEFYEALVECEEERESAEDLLEDFRVASRPVVHRMVSAVDSDESEHPEETSREFEWCEIEPLAKALKKLELREQRVVKEQR